MTDASGAISARYRPAFAGRTQRGTVLAVLLLTHAAFFALMIWQGAGQARHSGAQGRSGIGQQVVFDLRPPAADAGSARAGGGKGAPVTGLPTENQPREEANSGFGDKANPGQISLGDELAGALADDPFAGGGLSSYQLILRMHIAAHSKGLPGRLLRPGMVLLRFRVARDGSVIDAQVLDAPEGGLGELALAALWRAEPLPRVPDNLSAPLEVDVPLDFRVHG